MGCGSGLDGYVTPSEGNSLQKQVLISCQELEFIQRRLQYLETAVQSVYNTLPNPVATTKQASQVQPTIAPSLGLPGNPRLGTPSKEWLLQLENKEPL